MIVTELVINSLKHAFNERARGGQISVAHEVSGTDWRLSVADNGAGNRAALLPNQKSGLGTGIVTALAKQLDAQVETLSGPQGTTVSLTHATFSGKISPTAVKIFGSLDPANRAPRQVSKNLEKWSKQNITLASGCDPFETGVAPRCGAPSHGLGVPPPHRGRYSLHAKASRHPGAEDAHDARRKRLTLKVGRYLLPVAVASLFACDGIAQTQDGDHAPDTMAARVLACASCHGDKGQGTSDDYFPRLAGKPAGYLYNQLVAFRDGRRKYPPMNYLLEFLPDSYLKAMADYFASAQPPFPPPATPVVSTAMLARGETLATKGDPAHEIPACANCHGPSFTGMEPAIPGLLGLRATYIGAQLGAWRYGTRTAAAPDCMQIVAGHLTEDDVKALAAWLASRPMPASPAPVAHGSLPMPLPCGSEPN